MFHYIFKAYTFSGFSSTYIGSYGGCLSLDFFVWGGVCVVTLNLEEIFKPGVKLPEWSSKTCKSGHRELSHFSIPLEHATFG